jgi:lipopolysaccharide/colanic/teichoic acid biosynthesis glycosyltransferase
MYALEGQLQAGAGGDGAVTPHLSVCDDIASDEIVVEHLRLADSVFKRAIDLMICPLLLALLVPVLLVAIVAIKLSSRGPALFTQVRVGLGGRRFRLYKLRTMTGDPETDRDWLQDLVLGRAESTRGVFKPPSRDRITRVGWLLRRFSLDEAPQLWNVLKGDMSMVGPRPALVEEVDVYDERAKQRLRVKPGLTGLSQINGRSELSFDRIVDLDLEYADQWSPSLELSILARTPVVVLTARGAG